MSQGKIEQGLKVYKRALGNLPPGYSDNRSFIRYNLALAYARANRLSKALIYLEVENAMSHSPVIKKIRSLLQKVTNSLRDNSPLVLTGGLPNPKRLALAHNPRDACRIGSASRRALSLGIQTAKRLPRRFIKSSVS